MGIKDRRKRIDEADRKLVRLLNKRIRMAIEVGRIKKASGLPLYDQSREREILRLANRANGGPLGPRTITVFFRWLLAHSRRQTARALNSSRRARQRGRT